MRSNYESYPNNNKEYLKMNINYVDDKNYNKISQKTI